MSLSSVNTRLDNQLSRMTCQTFEAAVLEGEDRVFADVAVARSGTDQEEPVMA